MKYWYVSLIVSILFVCGAIYLAAHNIGGWGWFLFGAIVTFVYPTNSKSSDEENN